MDFDDFPDLVDGATPITTGTAVNEAWWDLVQAALLGELRGATDPTRTSAQNIDEVLAARGAFGTLLARLTDWEARQYVTPAQVRNGFVLGNLLANDTFAMWSRGDAAAPDYWALSGAGAAVARCGDGQADTIALGMDHFSARLTYGSAPAVLSQFALPTYLQNALSPGFSSSRFLPVDATVTTVPGYGDDTDLQLYLIGHVYSDGVSRARIRLSAASAATSPYHPGNAAFCSLIAGPVNATLGTPIEVQCRVEGAGAAYFQCLSLVPAPSGLQPMYVPARARLREYTFPIIATPAAATGYGYFVPPRPFHALGLTASVMGAVPTGATTLKLDLMTPIGGVFQSLFTTLPAFVASDRHLIQACDPAAANYRRLTIRGVYAAGGGASLADNSVLRLDVNARDSGATATNVLATVIGFEYDRPLNQFRTMTDLGEA